MKNKFVFPAIILLLIILISILFYKNSREISQVCVKEHCFSVELAKTPAEQTKGLSNRSFLDQNKGMLFIFQKADIYSFWMKDTLIPLDMIWIKDNKIVFIERNALPCIEANCSIFNKNAVANYVLEINGNISEKYDFNIGDNISFVRS